MPPQNLGTPPETPRDPVEIRHDAAITVQQAILIANQKSVSLGKSTLQRWAKHWAQLGNSAPVKSILIDNREGRLYRIDKNDFEAWIFDQQSNTEPPEAFEDLTKPHEILRGPERPREIPRDPERSHEASEKEPGEVAKLRDENMQLKIDLEVRKQLLTKAVEQAQNQDEKIDALLRENGALGYRLLQLDQPAAKKADQSFASGSMQEGGQQPQRMAHTVIVENVPNRSEPAA